MAPQGLRETGLSLLPWLGSISVLALAGQFWVEPISEDCWTVSLGPSLDWCSLKSWSNGAGA
jgi:hypothetical protein